MQLRDICIFPILRGLQKVGVRTLPDRRNRRKANDFGGDNHWCLGSLCKSFTPCVCGDARSLVVPDPYCGVRTVTAGPSTLRTQNVDDVVTTTGVMNPAS